MLDLYSTKDRGVVISKTTWPVNSSQALKSLSAEQKSERRWRVEGHRDIKSSKQSGSFLSPVKVRPKRGKRSRRESTSKYSTADMKSSNDNDGRRIKNHFELKKDNGKRLFGANEERLAAIQKGTRRDNQKEGLPGLELGSTDQKAKTIHEVTTEKQCKLPPLKSTRKSGTDLLAMHATEDASTLSEDTSQREEEIQKPTSVSTAALYDLNELQKKLKLKQENQEGILKLKQDGDAEPSDGKISTHREEITVEKNDKKVRFEPEASESDVKCTVKTVTFPLQLVKLGQQCPIPGKGEKNAVVFPRIADQNSRGLYGTLMGSRGNCNSLAYFRLDHGGSLRRRMKPHKQTDGKSATVECRGQACFPGFVSLPSLEKVADWLTR